MQIRYGTVLAASAEAAFGFVSEPENWPRFFRHMRSAVTLEAWGEVGGQATMVNRLLGRDIVTDLVLVEWDPPRSFRYVGHNRGRPDTDNLRMFEAVPGGTRFTGTTTAEPRRGPPGLVDQITFLAVRRTYHQAMRQLPGQLAGPRQGAG